MLKDGSWIPRCNIIRDSFSSLSPVVSIYISYQTNSNLEYRFELPKNKEDFSLTVCLFEKEQVNRTQQYNILKGF